jgi:hypothetical protein
VEDKCAHTSGKKGYRWVHTYEKGNQYGRSKSDKKELDSDNCLLKRVQVVIVHDVVCYGQPNKDI